MYSSNRRPRRVEITDIGFDGFFTMAAVGNGPDPTHIMSKDDRDHHPQQRHTFPSANLTPFTPAYIGREGKQWPWGSVFGIH